VTTTRPGARLDVMNRDD